MKSKIEQLKNDALALLEKITDRENLEALKTDVLGRKGKLNELMKEMMSLAFEKSPGAVTSIHSSSARRNSSCSNIERSLSPNAFSIEPFSSFANCPMTFRSSSARLIISFMSSFNFHLRPSTSVLSASRFSRSVIFSRSARASFFNCSIFDFILFKQMHHVFNGHKQDKCHEQEKS